MFKPSLYHQLRQSMFNALTFPSVKSGRGRRLCSVGTSGTVLLSNSFTTPEKTVGVRKKSRNLDIILSINVVRLSPVLKGDRIFGKRWWTNTVTLLRTIDLLPLKTNYSWALWRPRLDWHSHVDKRQPWKQSELRLFLLTRLTFSLARK